MLLAVLPCPAELNLSTTKILESGCLFFTWYAVDKPITPAPTTMASYSTGKFFPQALPEFKPQPRVVIKFAQNSIQKEGIFIYFKELMRINVRSYMVVLWV